MDCVEHILLCQKINIHEVWLATEGANRTDKVAQSNLNDKLNNTKYLLHFVCHYSATGPPKNPTHNEDTKLHNCKNVRLYIQCVFVFFKWQKLKRKTHERNINISSWEVYVIIIIKHRLCKNNKYINVNNVHTIILSSGQSTLVMYAHTQHDTVKPVNTSSAPTCPYVFEHDAPSSCCASKTLQPNPSSERCIAFKACTSICKTQTHVLSALI